MCLKVHPSPSGTSCPSPAESPDRKQYNGQHRDKDVLTPAPQSTSLIMISIRQADHTIQLQHLDWPSARTDDRDVTDVIVAL